MKELKNIKNQKVIVRCDFNVPIKKGKVGEDFKIKAVLPTIKLLLKNKNKLILVSHLGRPKGQRVKKLSVEPVLKNLKKQLRTRKIEFIRAEIDKNLENKVDLRFKKADIVLLENIRYDQRENKNQKNLARFLAKTAEVFVNEAFALSHRQTSSSVAICQYLPSYLGLRFQKEIDFLSQILNSAKPSCALIGGAKVRSKFQAVNRFLKIYSKVMLGGGVANTFLVAKGYKIGDSLFEPEYLRRAKRLIKSKRVILPIDVLVTDRKKENVKVVKIKKDKNICQKKEQILDIGPATVKKYSGLVKKAKTIVWSGPMGLLEDPRFSHGTIALARIIGARGSGKALAVAGGGETVSAIKKSHMSRYYDFISTGGGAMLEFLQGKPLPGYKAVKYKK